VSNYVSMTAGLTAFEALPDGAPKAGIILIQEVFGVNANIQALARQYAQAGYQVVAPDLFWRSEPGLQLDPGKAEDRSRAMQLNQAFDDELGLTDLAACAGYLKRTLGTQAKVFALGYCMGGRLSFLLAQRGAVDAAVSYYGVNIDQYLSPADQGAPRLIHLAEKDSLCSADAQQRILAWAAQTEGVEAYVYADAPHAFAREHSPAFLREAALLANQRTRQFLDGLS